MLTTQSIQKQINLISRGTERIIDLGELEAKLQRSQELNQPLVIKLGVDPTAPDIHLGHTVPLRKLKHFQQLGHDVHFLIGDFTGRIGDPTGRDKTRPPLTEEQILLNANTYLEQVTKLLDINKLKVVYNSQWLKDLNFGELITMAANTTLSKLLEHNTFRQRLESSDSIRMHELLYPFMQGYDSVALKADVELGGSDQTFNLTFGRDLQKFYNQEAQICITMPILTGTDGKQKMSKSLGNYIGISEPPAIIFDKIMRMVDSNIINYFTLLTDLPIEDITAMETQLDSNPDTLFIIESKKRLAFEIIKDLYTEDIATATINDYGKTKKEGLPILNLSGCLSEDGTVNILKLLTTKGGIKSNTEARRLITQGGVSINATKLVLEQNVIKMADGDVFKCGKTKIFLIELEEA